MDRRTPRERLSTRNDTYQIIESVKSNRRARARHGLIFVEGVAPINAAVATGMTAEMAVVPRRDRLSCWAHDTIQRLSPGRVIEINEPLFAELSERGTPSEMVLILRRPHPSLSDITIDRSSVIVVLDRPSNHGNLGSIIRSADAFGAVAVVTTGHCVDQYDPAVIRASLGAVFTTTVVHEPSSAGLRAWIQGVRGSWPGSAVLGTDSGGSVPLGQAPNRRPLVLIFGNEATGLAPGLRETVDAVVSIPISGYVNSLNLACAASIVLYSVSSRSDEPE
jgi:23S rRNA (uridine2479-2'-O)-methyltransferase